MADRPPRRPHDDDLPVFQSLRPSNGKATESRADAPARPSEPSEATDFASLMAEPVSARRPTKAPEATDYASLARTMPESVPRFAHRTLSDYLIDALTPAMIFVMVASVVYFLLDVRYIYTEVNDFSLRWFVAWAFILGIVAINRLVAREGSNESILYVIVFGLAIGLYTIAGQAYGSGSYAGRFMSGPGEAVFNMALVAFTWWAVNRLTHECCVDTHPEAGDMGILTGTARRMRDRMRAQPKEKRPEVYLDLEPFDPTTWEPPKPKKRTDPSTSSRPPKRHPGISVLYFSVVAMLAFALGQRVTLHGGPRIAAWGWFYIGSYTAAALTLLMLTSLGQLREFFRARQTALPRALSIFWVSLGVFMVLVVLVGAAALPAPRDPTPAAVLEHEYDPWNPRSTFVLEPPNVDQEDLSRQSAFLERLGQGVLVALGAFLVYGILRAIGATAASIARQRHRYPRFIVRICDLVDRILVALLRIPKLPSIQPRIRIDRGLASSAKYVNPLSRPEMRARMSNAEIIALSYDALCALAADLGAPRRPDQTPYEFLAAFPKRMAFLRDEARELTDMLVQSNYGGREFDERALDRLRKFWHSYERLRRRVLR